MKLFTYLGEKPEKYEHIRKSKDTWNLTKKTSSHLMKHAKYEDRTNIFDLGNKKGKLDLYNKYQTQKLSMNIVNTTLWRHQGYNRCYKQYN